uniref:Carbonic anhydrase n=1 Tax=Tetradesmus obliquus TaxID=3088 RepID=A0A383WNC4_TETOB|eukprot:jgi/Sobl393_1/13494/SZX78669.1
MAARTLSLLVFVLFISASSACIYEFGNRDEAAAKAGGHYDYSYNGLDWPGSFPQCRGKKQSPVMLPGTGAAAEGLKAPAAESFDGTVTNPTILNNTEGLKAPAAKSTFDYGTVTNPIIINNGHTLQVPLPADFKSDVKIPVLGDIATAKATSVLQAGSSGKATYVKAAPAQLHFHTHSEHVVSGYVYPMEMHIVHFVKKDQLPACGDAGCPVVLGVMLALTNDESKVTPELRKVIEAMPLNEGRNATIQGALDVDALLPKDRSYFTYEGSLTTPPCSEGLLWHVLTNPIYITDDLLTRYQEAVGNYDCPHSAAAAAAAAKNANAKNAKVTTESGPADNSGTEGGFQAPPADAKGCVKLADGHNYRAAQPLGSRTILLAA